MQEQTYRLTVGAGEEARLDRFVSQLLELSRTRVHKLVAEERVTVDARPTKKSEVV